MNFFKDFKPEIKLLLIVALIAVVVSVAGILLLKTMQSPPGMSDPALSEVEEWQTYRNDEFGFEVKYPDVYDADKEYESCRPQEIRKTLLDEGEKMQLFVANVGLIIMDSRGLDMSVYVDEYRKELIAELRPMEGKVGYYWGTNPGLPEETSLGGREALKIISNFAGASADMPVAIFVKRGENIFQFGYQMDENASHKRCRWEWDQSSEELAQAILATFRFVE